MKKLGLKKWILGALTLTLTLSNVAMGVTVAVVDSGTDMKHKDIAPKAWTNLLEIPENQLDDDKNGLVDDILGWNFSENDNQVINYKYQGTFSPDVLTFFTIQAKMLDGTVTSSDIMWVKEKLGDEKFAEELEVFSNYVHGTHVAGIAMKNAMASKVLALKIIPTEVKPPKKEGEGEGEPATPPAEEDRFRELTEMVKGKSETYRARFFKNLLDQLVGEQMSMMGKVADYLVKQKVDVANGSFGTGIKQAETIINLLFKPVFERSPKKSEVEEYALYFMKGLLREGQKGMKTASETLFVFAAGNEGTDNDELPTSPANIEASNVISVAATSGWSKLAKFSNYGKTMVDVAAPGVSIRSTIPGDEYMAMSGTSQAAPYVAGVAGEMKEANPDLTPADLKNILIKTSDVKDFLKGKVVSSGIVNRARALRAAVLSNSESVTNAVAHALKEVPDVVVPESEEKALREEYPEAGKYILPLPSQFSF